VVSNFAAVHMMKPTLAATAERTMETRPLGQKSKNAKDVASRREAKPHIQRTNPDHPKKA
jgi:hypothetical protein